MARVLVTHETDDGHRETRQADPACEKELDEAISFLQELKAKIGQSRNAVLDTASDVNRFEYFTLDEPPC